jgi:spermidine synthase
MKPSVRLATAKIPGGGEMELYQHDRDFTIKINGQDLMSSRQHESELELARLGCAHLVGNKAPRVLIGGLGLGYTLRQVLDMLNPNAKVVVSELLGAVVEWNRDFLGELNGQPLEDERVDIKTGDVVSLISRSNGKFDAILLDIDNGPSAMTSSANSRLYGYEGLMACRYALREKGCLAVWSAEPSKKFERLLVGGCGFHVRRFRVPTYKGSKSQSHFVWVVSENKANLPPGGGEPRLSRGDESKEGRRRPRDGY